MLVRSFFANKRLYSGKVKVKNDRKKNHVLNGPLPVNRDLMADKEKMKNERKKYLKSKHLKSLWNKRMDE